MPNTTCPVLESPTDPVPFYSNGAINFKAHDVGWIICGFFTLVASGASFWLIWKHLTYYTCPQQQRHIVRMLFMVPIYAVVSTLSYVFFREAIYYQTVRDCYEAVVITSFFNLLLQYVGDTPAEQQEVFRQVKLKKWFFPLNYWKYRPDGLHFLWLMKICILQYAIVRPVCTLTAVGLQYFGLYCLESWEPYFGHIWISLAISISVSVAMFCVIQFYLPIADELKPYAPVLKFLAVKSVVFLTFWQDSFLSILVYFGAIKASKYMTAADIQVGINALCETFEMVIFGFLHIKAFTYLIYRPQDRTRTTKRGRALLDVLDFRDWWYDMKHTTRYVQARRKGVEYTVVDDIRREKYQHLEKALGRDRWAHLQAEQKLGKQRMPTFWKHDQDEERSELLMRVSDLEKPAVAMSDEDHQGEKRPRGNLAMRAEYDPEKDDEGALEEEPLMWKPLHASSDDRKEPILPSLSYRAKEAILLRHDTHPELSQYHRTAIEEEEGDDNGGADDFPCENDDIFVPRKGGRARKEASLGLGAWWRAFRERVSGNVEEEEAVEATETKDEEKRIMLGQELDRGIAALAGKRAPLADDGLTPSPARGMSNGSSDSSDASASVLQSRNSPLSLIINEHGRERLTMQGKDDTPVRIKPSSRERQVAVIKDCDTMARHSSTRIAVDTKDDVTELQRSKSDLHHASPGPQQKMGQVERMSRAMNSVTMQAPHIDSVVPSISGSYAASIVSAPSNSISTADLQRQRTQTRPSSGSMAAAGPKGKSIPLVLPQPLSPSNFPPVKPVSSLPLARQSSNPTSSGMSVSAARGSMSKIRFADTNPISRRSDDPEAEPVRLAGTVTVGAQSLKQVSALKSQREAEQARRHEEEKMRLRGFNRPKQQQQQQQQHSQPQAGSRGQGTRGRGDGQDLLQTSQGIARTESRMRRLSEPAQAVRQRDSTVTATLPPSLGIKGRLQDPYIALPAPSQLAQMGNRQDPFAAAVVAASSESHYGLQTLTPDQIQKRAERHENAGQARQARETAASRRVPTLEVGSIVHRQDLIAATTPGHDPRWRDTAPSNRHYTGAAVTTGRPAAVHSRPLPQSTRRPVRHSIGSLPPSNPAAVTYDRYSGEPAWIEGRQVPSRVESRRRQYEAPQGFQFDYID